MKKLLLSLAVSLSFITYAIFHNSKPLNNTASANTTQAISTPSNILYKDGTYTGDLADAYYGSVQVQVQISNGHLSDVSVLQYPSDRSTSLRINSSAIPILKSEAIQTQNGKVDAVSGATATSGAFNQSLSSALSQAS